MARTSPLSRDAAEGRPVLASRAPVERGRLGVYAALGATLSAVPIPWLPDSLVRRVRGALVNDVAVRHGLSLTPEAREVLAEPSGPDGPRGLLAQVARYFATRVAARFGPASLLWAVRDAARTYVLGHLFDRYLEMVRSERAVRIDVDEARRVRLAVDQALTRALTVDAPAAPEPAALDDQRDTVTALFDGVLGLAAGLPARVAQRLDAAFDELWDDARG